MQQNHVPEQIDYQQWAQLGRGFYGDVPVALMPRLQGYLDAKDHARIEVDCEFKVTASGHFTVSGCLSADLELRCQRCLQGVEEKVTAQYAVCFVDSDDKSDDVPAGFDAYVATESEIDLVKFLEDEIILALPIVARHAIDDCKIDTKAKQTLNEAVPEEFLPINPFAVLNDIKYTNS